MRLGIIEYRENVVVTPEKIMTAGHRTGSMRSSPRTSPRSPALQPEVALLGTGATIRFPHPRLTRALTDARIGLEVMDTPAACRTFNILAAEGRKVAVAILLSPD